MKKNYFFATALISLTILLSVVTNEARAQFSTGDKIVYAYFLEDPVSTMHVAWVGADNGPLSMEIRRSGSSNWSQREPTREVAISGSEYKLREVRLRSLIPGTSYVIRFEDGGEEYRIRTLPDSLDRPFSFVKGGDMYGSSTTMRNVAEHAAKKDPWFAAIGGDWAYADGDPAKVSRWFSLFEIWQETMITPAGYMVPFVPAIGNHEVVGGYGEDPDLAPLYFTFFGKPGNRSYYTMDAGNYLSLIVLDSNHTASVSGVQKEWLDKVLSDRRNIEHLFPLYHVAAWPSFREPSSIHPRSVRTHWIPLFEKYGVKLAFENHDHTFKRTKPVRGDEVHEDGVIYIGDGSWGVAPRTPVDPSERWYLEKTAAENHFWHITISQGLRVATAINDSGVIIDQFSQESGRAPQYRSIDMEDLPNRVLLAQNYPNPFNASTVISFYIPEGGEQNRATLEVFSTDGRRIAMLADEHFQPGTHDILFKPGDHSLASGIYIYRMRHGGTTVTRKMNFLK